MDKISLFGLKKENGEQVSLLLSWRFVALIWFIIRIEKIKMLMTIL